MQEDLSYISKYLLNVMLGHVDRLGMLCNLNWALDHAKKGIRIFNLLSPELTATLMLLIACCVTVFRERPFLALPHGSELQVSSQTTTMARTKQSHE